MERGMTNLTKAIICFSIMGIFVLSYFIFFYFPKCDDLSCFFSHQAKCSRAVYINDGESLTLEYKILGKEKNLCEIEVKSLMVKKGESDKVSLEGYSMKCYKELLDLSYPESDLSECHGRLKEQIQEVMIQRAHSEIVKNLGALSEEIKKVI
jgi:hypothetical protein